MAPEAKITTPEAINALVKSMVDTGIGQVNLMSNSVQTLLPAFTALNQALFGTVEAVAKSVVSTVGSVAGATTSLGGTLIGAAGQVAGAQLQILGSLVGAAVSTVQSGFGFVFNAIGSILPGRKI